MYEGSAVMGSVKGIYLRKYKHAVKRHYRRKEEEIEMSFHVDNHATSKDNRRKEKECSHWSTKQVILGVYSKTFFLMILSRGKI